VEIVVHRSLPSLLATIVVAWASCINAAAAASDPLEGLWVSETRFGPALQGELTLARTDQGWRATIADAEATAPVSGNSVRIAFPDERGAFRGELAADGASIEGYWQQPSGATDDRRNPGGSGQSFVTPVVLHAGGADTWRGTVQPLEDRFTLYLRIFRNADGALVAAFRNPELNSRGGASQFHVAREEDSVVFTARPSDTGIRLTAKRLTDPDRLRVAWPDVGTLELERRTPAEAPHFFPRPPGEPRYVYQRPPKTGDGWATARAQRVGMDEARLARLVQRLIDIDPSSQRPALVHSVLVARQGRLVLEEYFYGHDRDTPHDMRSAGKTFSSVMLGAAMMRGATIAPDTKIYELLADGGPYANPDPRKRHITLAHLLTHSAGLACDDNDEASPGNEGTMSAQTAQPDWWKYTLDLPMVHLPGVRYAYCSANTNLVGAALTKATGTWLPEFFDRTVAQPLGFGRWHWNVMPNGEGYQGGGAFVRPRDLLKIGQAYLDGGRWYDKQIVTPEWVVRSTAPRMRINEATTGLSAGDFGNAYAKSTDAYAWHLFELRSGRRAYREYEASGNGGQLLIVVPEAELVVVFTAGNYMQGGIWGRFRSEIVPNDILGAIRR
jgi:CubicO group peptidase (beta-lactamase class C family)